MIYRITAEDLVWNGETGRDEWREDTHISEAENLAALSKEWPETHGFRILKIEALGEIETGIRDRPADD